MGMNSTVSAPVVPTDGGSYSEASSGMFTQSSVELILLVATSHTPTNSILSSVVAAAATPMNPSDSFSSSQASSSRFFNFSQSSFEPILQVEASHTPTNPILSAVVADAAPVATDSGGEEKVGKEVSVANSPEFFFFFL